MISTALAFVIPAKGKGEVEESKTQNMFVDLIVLKLICFEMQKAFSLGGEGVSVADG